MKIRRYQTADRERLLEITAEVFGPVSVFAAAEREFSVINGVHWQERKRAEVAAQFEATNQVTLVAEIDGGPVGFVTTVLGYETLTGYIANLAGAADHQSRGVGKALINAALDYFAAEGMMYSQIETLACNERGKSFYPKVGYQEIARKIYYFMRMADRPQI